MKNKRCSSHLYHLGNSTGLRPLCQEPRGRLNTFLNIMYVNITAPGSVHFFFLILGRVFPRMLYDELLLLYLVLAQMSPSQRSLP